MTQHPERARPLKPPRIVAGDWRGGRLVAVGATTIDIEVCAEQHYRHVYQIEKALSPLSAVDDACIVRIGNLGANPSIANYVIVEVKPARFCGHVQSTADMPNHGHIPYELTGESPYWNWSPDEG